MKIVQNFIYIYMYGTYICIHSDLLYIIYKYNKYYIICSFMYLR